MPQKHLQAAKIAGSSVSDTFVAVGEKGVHVSFEDWLVPEDIEDNSTLIAAVTTLGTSNSEGTNGKMSKLQTPNIGLGSADICDMFPRAARRMHARVCSVS